MTIYYEAIPRRNPQKEEEVKYYASAKIFNEVHTKELAQRIQDETSFVQGDVIGFLKTLSDMMQRALADGNRVVIEGVGSFEVQLTSDAAQDFKALRKAHVRCKNIRFRPSKAFKEGAVHRLSPVQTQLRHQEVQQTSSAVRKLRLKEYLKENRYISRPDYDRITGLRRTKSLEELNAFVAEGWLDKIGKRAQTLYVLAR